MSSVCFISCHVLVRVSSSFSSCLKCLGACVMLMIPYDGSGVSSFNKLIHELSVESDSSAIDSTSGDEDDADMFPASPSSQVSHLSRASSFARYDRRLIHLIWYMLSWILWPVIIIMRIPFIIRGRSVPDRGGAITTDGTRHPTRRTVSLKDHVVHRTTDRRRGVIEVLACI